MWSRRAQEYEAKISSGKIYELAEVVRDLNKGDDLILEIDWQGAAEIRKSDQRIVDIFILPPFSETSIT